MNNPRGRWMAAGLLAALCIGCLGALFGGTREAGYRKKPTVAMPLIRWKYRKYPNFVQSSETRYIRYNETLDLLEELERKGEVFVIRPQKKVELGRLEKNPEKLKALYEEGFAEARALFPKLLEFIGKK